MIEVYENYLRFLASNVLNVTEAVLTSLWFSRPFSQQSSIEDFNIVLSRRHTHSRNLSSAMLLLNSGNRQEFKIIKLDSTDLKWKANHN